MDYNKIKEAAQNYEADMTKFLRDLVHFPGESCGSKDPNAYYKKAAEGIFDHEWTGSKRSLALIKLRLTQWEISLAIWELEALSSVSTDILIL